MSEQKKYNPEGEGTSTTSEISYVIEKMLVRGNTQEEIEEYIQVQKDKEGFPPHLQYQDSFYDPKTGVAGCAFLDTRTGQMIIGYPGTNVKADGMKDILTDLSLAIGSQGHVSEAVKFYERLAKEGYPIVLTGHSLGGNIAVLVALITNNPMTVTYNGAPLTASNAIEFLAGLLGDDALALKALLKAPGNANLTILNQLIEHFSGNVIRFVSDKDILNNSVGLVNALYIGNEYVLYNKNPHDMSHFLNEDIQLYLSKIIDMEQHKTVYENINVDVDGDGKTDVTRSARQLIVKNLLGTPGGNATGSSEKIQINPDALIHLSVNLKVMANDDLLWADKNVSVCARKNEAIEGSFETRRNRLNESVIEGLESSGLGSLLTAIDDSFGEMKNQKSILETLSDFNPYDITRKFDSLGVSGTVKWFKGGVEWTFSDVGTFGGQLRELMEASYTLKHNVNMTDALEETYNGTIYRHESISAISKALVAITNSLESKIKKAFEGIGLRDSKEDGITQALTDVFEVEHKNISELKRALSSVSELTAAIAINYEERDQWLKQSIENGEMTATTNVHVPATYEAFLEETAIFDDVKNVLQAFDEQVEEKSKQLSNEIASSYTDILTQVEAQTTVIREGMNTFKNLITALLSEMSLDITYEESPTISYHPDSELSRDQSKQPLEKQSVGRLEDHFPAEVREAIEDAEHKILPLIDIFNAALNACQTFHQGVHSMENYLKPVIEKGVYTAFDLDEIIQVQLLTSEVLSRMFTELMNLSDDLTQDNLGSAITNLATRINDARTLLVYFNEMIQNCFGTQVSNTQKPKGRVRSTGKSRYAGTF
ncbi:SA1320 family protein [Isobaculum melis]|uniref:Lipase (Class 3) n=1 Tax=Isobaculum melis TaxID=142588 RepID=A0A1H9PUS6_9LACT|nr:hypothetical protein [Isobaculum melis]SER51977.1 Lipase (class 3) [Isobaculum melis]